MGVGESEASQFFQQWGMCLAKPSIFACLTPTGKSWFSETSIYSGWKSSFLNGNNYFTNYQQVFTGLWSSVDGFPHTHYCTLAVLEFCWPFYCLVSQHHAILLWQLIVARAAVCTRSQYPEITVSSENFGMSLFSIFHLYLEEYRCQHWTEGVHDNCLSTAKTDCI